MGVIVLRTSNTSTKVVQTSFWRYNISKSLFQRNTFGHNFVAYKATLLDYFLFEGRWLYINVCREITPKSYLGCDFYISGLSFTLSICLWPSSYCWPFLTFTCCKSLMKLQVSQNWLWVNQDLTSSYAFFLSNRHPTTRKTS